MSNCCKGVKKRSVCSLTFAAPVICRLRVSNVSLSSSSVRTLTLRGFLHVPRREVRIQIECADEGETWFLHATKWKGPSHGGNKDTLHSRRQVIVGFASPRPTFQFYTLLLLKWFSQRAITGHVPVKTTYSWHTHTLASHTSFHRTSGRI